MSSVSSNSSILNCPSHIVFVSARLLWAQQVQVRTLLPAFAVCWCYAAIVFGRCKRETIVSRVHVMIHDAIAFVVHIFVFNSNFPFSSDLHPYLIDASSPLILLRCPRPNRFGQRHSASQ